MKKDKQWQVSRGRRGSNESKLVLVDVASGKTRNLGSPSIPHAEAGSFASWILLEPYAIRGRRVRAERREEWKTLIRRSNSGEAYGVMERNLSGGPLGGTHNLGGSCRCVDTRPERWRNRRSSGRRRTRSGGDRRE